MNKKSISYKDLVVEDLKVYNYLGTKFKGELVLFSESCELYISLFSHAKRINIAKGKIDFIQLVAVRLLQDARAAWDMGLKGMYPQSASLIRANLESLLLIHDFKINPKNEDIWFNGSKKKREKLFRASEVRKRVSKANVKGFDSIKELYNSLSQFSVHTNMESHIWYMETKGKKLQYHWAGRVKSQKWSHNRTATYFIPWTSSHDFSRG